MQSTSVIKTILIKQATFWRVKGGGSIFGQIQQQYLLTFWEQLNKRVSHMKLISDSKYEM